jgi:hypothetical protein
MIKIFPYHKQPTVSNLSTDYLDMCGSLVAGKKV